MMGLNPTRQNNASKSANRVSLIITQYGIKKMILPKGTLTLVPGLPLGGTLGDSITRQSIGHYRRPKSVHDGDGFKKNE